MEAQKKYYNSPKGKLKLLRQNEKRRNKTKYNKVVRQIEFLFTLLAALGRKTLKYGGRLRFLENRLP